MKTIFATVIAALFATTASAQQQTPKCTERANAVEALTERYGEAPYLMMLEARGILEVWGNPETRTWSLTVTNAQGITCLVANGGAFEVMSGDLPAAGEDM